MKTVSTTEKPPTQILVSTMAAVQETLSSTPPLSQQTTAVSPSCGTPFRPEALTTTAFMTPPRTQAQPAAVPVSPTLTPVAPLTAHPPCYCQTTIGRCTLCLEKDRDSFVAQQKLEYPDSSPRILNVNGRSVAARDAIPTAMTEKPPMDRKEEPMLEPTASSSHSDAVSLAKAVSLMAASDTLKAVLDKVTSSTILLDEDDAAMDD